MALTVAVVVADVVARVGVNTLTAVGLSTLADATNPDVVRAVRSALRYVGADAADPATVTDADLTGITGARAEKLYDAARLETLYSALGASAAEFDNVVGDNGQKASQIRDGIAKAIAMLEDRMRRPYGPMVPSSTVGTMSAGVPMPNDPLRPCSRVNPWTWPYPQ